MFTHFCKPLRDLCRRSPRSSGNNGHQEVCRQSAARMCRRYSMDRPPGECDCLRPSTIQNDSNCSFSLYRQGSERESQVPGSEDVCVGSASDQREIFGLCHSPTASTFSMHPRSHKSFPPGPPTADRCESGMGQESPWNGISSTKTQREWQTVQRDRTEKDRIDRVTRVLADVEDVMNSA